MEVQYQLMEQEWPQEVLRLRWACDVGQGWGWGLVTGMDVRRAGP